MIWTYAFLALAIAAASFYWLRGVWKGCREDSVVGALFMAFCCLAARVLDGTTCLLNDVGLCIIGLGLLTIIIGRLRRRAVARRMDLEGLVLMGLGTLLAVLL
jgi:hypothetical protein